MASVYFSPALQAPIALAPVPGAAAVGGLAPAVIAQANPIPLQAAISLGGVGPVMGVALTLASPGSISLGSAAQGVVQRAVTPRVPTVGALSLAGVAPVVQLNQLLALWPDPLPDGVIGVPYTFQLTVSGGTPPYTWSIIAGSLPPGLSLNASTGLISGTPLGPTVSMQGVTPNCVDVNG